jgi:hypothetical protein
MEMVLFFLLNNGIQPGKVAVLPHFKYALHSTAGKAKNYPVK